MKALWGKNILYNAGRKYVDLCARMSYSKIVIHGKENIPVDEPFIYASSHSTAMMDPLMILLLSPKSPVLFGARADMFKSDRIASALLHWIKIVPLSRAHDGKEAVTENYRVFDEIAETMRHGIPFCLFPQGTHYPDNDFHPVRKGVVRIAKLAEEKIGKPVKIIPVGLAYEDFFHYMTEVHINIGKPVLAEGDPRDTMDVLAKDIHSLRQFRPGKEFKREWWKYLLALLSLPLFLLCGAICSPLILVSGILILLTKDKAWCNTFRYLSRFLFFPLWPFHSAFYYLLNFYRKLI